jgi:hypothetical protein
MPEGCETTPQFSKAHHLALENATPRGIYPGEATPAPFWRLHEVSVAMPAPMATGPPYPQARGAGVPTGGKDCP